MSDSKGKDYPTKAIHAGQDYNQWTNSEVVPSIVVSATFQQKDPIDIKGYCYTRAGNPTRSALERCIAELDEGKFCLTFPSGCAALTDVLHLVKTGEHVIASMESYGGTRTLLLYQADLQSIQVDFVESTNASSIKAAIKPNTKLIWIETPSNPCLKVSDVKAISDIAHSCKDMDILVVVDNTLLTSYFQRPLTLGADIVMYSLTKYMNGHNDVLMGALVVNNEKLYDRLRFVQIKYGLIPSPFDCYLVNRGLKTLPLRMKQHCENGLAIAKYLEAHPYVVKVHHPGLESHPQYELSKIQSTGYCGLLAVQIEGTVNEAKRFIQSLKIFTSCGSLGSFNSLAVIPARVSHINVPEETRELLEIFDTTIRVSVGLESVNDLIEDLEQAFAATYK